MNKLLEWFKLLFNMADAVQESKEVNRKQQAQIDQLVVANELLYAELRRCQQVETLEREKFKLEVMNEFLRRLPPSAPPSPQLPPPQP